MDLKLEILPTIIDVCFILHNYSEKSKVYIDDEVVKSQIEILKKNEENYKNVPDPIFLFDCGEGTITRKQSLISRIVDNLIEQVKNDKYRRRSD